MNPFRQLTHLLAKAFCLVLVAVVCLGATPAANGSEKHGSVRATLVKPQEELFSGYSYQHGPVVNADIQVKQWLMIAATVWGESPVNIPNIECSNGVVVDVFNRYVDDDTVVASAAQPGCGITLEPEYYPIPEDDQGDEIWEVMWATKMCNVVVHEYGHLLGYGHTEDHNHTGHTAHHDDIMDSFPASLIPACDQAALETMPTAAVASAKRNARLHYKKSRRVCKRKQDKNKTKTCLRRAKQKWAINKTKAKKAQPVFNMHPAHFNIEPISTAAPRHR